MSGITGSNEPDYSRFQNDGVTDFYTELTPFYHLIYGNWQASINRQGQMLDAVIRQKWPVMGVEVLDVACGIGTQSLGLAQLGYQVTASDVTAAAVERARIEAVNRDLAIGFSVADMRVAFAHHTRVFDVVIAADNAVPHLLSDEDIRLAFNQLFACTRPGGGCLITVRDYDVERTLDSETMKLYGTRQQDGVNYMVFQRWEWQGDYYDLSMYFVEDSGQECVTHVMRSRYYAISVQRLCNLLGEVGFTEVARLDDVFFQPLIVGTRPR